MAVPHVWPVKTPLGDVVADVCAMHAIPSYISTEVNGVGAMPSQEVLRGLRGRPGKRRWNFVSTTSRSKTAGYGTILGLLEQGQLVLPRHPDLLRQLAGLRFEQGERGFTRIAADDPAVHDDVADSVMLASVPYVVRSGRVLCALAHMAAPEGAVAEADIPELSEPVVQTGGGLRIYRRPPLQGIADLAVTLPAGVESGAMAPSPSSGASKPPVPPHLARARERVQASLQKGSHNA